MGRHQPASDSCFRRLSCSTRQCPGDPSVDIDQTLISLAIAQITPLQGSPDQTRAPPGAMPLAKGPPPRLGLVGGTPILPRESKRLLATDQNKQNKQLELDRRTTKLSPMTIEFSADVWYWRGPAPFFFVTVPESTQQKSRGWSASSPTDGA